MHISYKNIYTLIMLLMASSMIAAMRQEKSTIPTQYQKDYSNANMINNKADRAIQVKLNYNSGKSVGPLPIDKNGAIILNEDFSDIANVVIDQKEFTQCTQKGRIVKLPLKSPFSTISYLEGKRGPQLVIQ